MLKRGSKEHIFVGDNGQACIANTGHSRIAPIGLAALKSNVASGTMSLEQLRFRWAAPELQRPDEYAMSKVVATKPSDIYGMGMVIYEVSPRDSFALHWYSIPTQILAREVPFREYTDLAVLVEIQNGKRPQRPVNAASLGITDSIWMLLEQCWDWEPSYRPNSAHVLAVLREACKSRDTGAATSARFKLKMKDVTISLTQKRKIKPYLAFQYGSRSHTTSRAKAVVGNKYIWYGTPLVSAPSPVYTSLQA